MNQFVEDIELECNLGSCSLEEFTEQCHIISMDMNDASLENTTSTNKETLVKLSEWASLFLTKARLEALKKSFKESSKYVKVNEVSITELDLSPRVSKYLNATLLLLIDGRAKTITDNMDGIEYHMILESIYNEEVMKDNSFTLRLLEALENQHAVLVYALKETKNMLKLNDEELSKSTSKINMLQMILLTLTHDGIGVYITHHKRVSELQREYE